jgi:hypothetical protein
MNSKGGWEQSDDAYKFGNATAKRFDEPNAFVIMSFGAGANADDAFDCMVAAMPFGQIAIHGDEANRVLARQLVDSDRVRFCPFIGLPFDAFGVAGVKTR